MRNILIAAAAAFSLAVIPMSVDAAPCKDAKGKFVKCPPAAAASTATRTSSKAKTTKGSSKMAGRCRNAKGQFAKCGTPGAKPA